MKICRFMMMVICLVLGAQAYAAPVNNSQQAAKIVKAKYGGKVLKVNTAKHKGNKKYFVKILKGDGKIISIKVDAKTGKMSRR